MRLVHPPSRLSPPPGSSMQEVPYNQTSARESPTVPPSSAAGSSTGTPAKRKGEDRVPKRGYRACVSLTAAGEARDVAVRDAALVLAATMSASVHANITQVHCRARKAKCDLGDPNAPSEPPCSRCRREQRNCIFLPSVSYQTPGGVRPLSCRS